MVYSPMLISLSMIRYNTSSHIHYSYPVSDMIYNCEHTICPTLHPYLPKHTDTTHWLITSLYPPCELYNHMFCLSYFCNYVQQIINESLSLVSSIRHVFILYICIAILQHEHLTGEYVSDLPKFCLSNFYNVDQLQLATENLSSNVAQYTQLYAAMELTCTLIAMC